MTGLQRRGQDFEVLIFIRHLLLLANILELISVHDLLSGAVN
jgi:hypothetical protein